MPSERFEKLDEKKRQRILDAARQEFARVPYEAASINQIIRNAGISRGSFYTYFEDKRDLLCYIFYVELQKQGEQFKQLLLEHGGKLWTALDIWCRAMADKIGKADNLKLAVQIVLQAGVAFQLDVQQSNCSRQQKEDREYAEWMLMHVDPEDVDVGDDPEQMRALLELIRITMMTSLFQMIMLPQEKEENLQFLQKKMDILKKGVKREA